MCRHARTGRVAIKVAGLRNGLHAASQSRPDEARRHHPGEAVYSDTSVLAEIATLTRNTIRLHVHPAIFDKLAEP
jgi:hypothetical protein